MDPVLHPFFLNRAFLFPDRDTETFRKLTEDNHGGRTSPGQQNNVSDYSCTTVPGDFQTTKRKVIKSGFALRDVIEFDKETTANIVQVEHNVSEDQSVKL